MGMRLDFGPQGWDLCLEAEIWALRLRFGPRRSDLSLGHGIWASRMEIGCEAGIWASRLVSGPVDWDLGQDLSQEGTEGEEEGGESSPYVLKH